MNSGYILSYLISYGIVDDEAILNFGIKILKHSTRNHCFEVNIGTEGYFIKSPNMDRYEADITFLREVAVYKTYSGILTFIPSLIFFDPITNTLCTRLERSDRPKDKLLNDLTNKVLLTSFLESTIGKIDLVTEYPKSHRNKPWITEIYSEASKYTAKSKFCHEILPYIRGDRELVKKFSLGSRLYNFDSTIHGDLKLENIIFRAEDTFITDWEFLGKGDRIYDIASLASSILCGLVLGDKLTDKAYANVMNISNEIAHSNGLSDHPEKLQLYIGMKLLQYSIEFANNNTNLGANFRNLVNCAINLIRATNV